MESMDMPEAPSLVPQAPIPRPSPEGPAAERRFAFEVGEILAAPDGYYRACKAVNGQIPGPPVIVERGELVCVSVTNALPATGTTMHWHGQYQRGSWFMDGVSMITQRPIPAGAHFEYRFHADPVGSHWYHSHFGLQYNEGLFGPLIVLDREEPWRDAYDLDYVVIFNDWYHEPPEQTLANIKAGRLPMVEEELSDSPFVSALINGVGQFVGPERYASYAVQPGCRVRLRLINASASFSFRFSIDGHRLGIIAADGMDLAPPDGPGGASTESIVVNIAERYDVIVRCDQAPARYRMRVRTLEPSVVHEVQAVLAYEGCEDFAPDAPPTEPDQRLDLKPLVAVRPPEAEVVRTLWLGGTMMPYLWTIGVDDAERQVVFEHPSKPFTEGESGVRPPRLQDGALHGTQVLTVEEGQVVQLVLNNGTGMDHPFHLHGHEFFLLGVHDGPSDEDAPPTVFDPDTDPLNTVDPIHRDTIMVPAGGWAVIRLVADNPGYWFFHCHIEWHMATGMDIVLRYPNAPAVPPGLPVFQPA